MKSVNVSSLAEAFADTQARCLCHSVLLEAIVMSHPDPGALLDAWNRASAPVIASVSTDLAAGTQRQGYQLLLDAIQHWSQKLKRLPEQGTPSG